MLRRHAFSGYADICTIYIGIHCHLRQRHVTKYMRRRIHEGKVAVICFRLPDNFGAMIVNLAVFVWFLRHLQLAGLAFVHLLPPTMRQSIWKHIPLGIRPMMHEYVFVIVV